MIKRVLQTLLFMTLLTGIALAVIYRDAFSGAALEQWMADFGAFGPLVFMLLYALATVLFLPGSVLTLAGGALFGPLWGTFYNLTGATVGALLAFLIARYLAADWAARRSEGRLARLKQGVETEGWRFVAFVRLVPLFPFNALNYALGLTRIRLSHYLIASYVCMLPGALAYTYLGYAGREALGGGEGLVQKILLALALLAAAIFLPRLIGRLRQQPMMTVDELKVRLAQPNAPLLLDVRSGDEFVGNQGHIPGAVNIPLEQLTQRLGELDAYQAQEIVLVCVSDRRSSKAERLLRAHAFSDLKVVRDGMNAWHAHGYAVEH